MTIPLPTDQQQMRGILFILSGPSGVGKDTVLRQALPKIQNIRTSISVTTRAPRRGEIDGVSYFFVSESEFAQRLKQEDFLEHALVHAHSYGTPRGWVMEQLRSGTDVVLEIDVQGALQVKSLFPQAILIFLAPPNWDELLRRLQTRNTEDAETIQRRVTNARHEMTRLRQYEYLIINDKLSAAVAQFHAIVTAERLRPWRQELSSLLNEETIHG